MVETTWIKYMGLQMVLVITIDMPRGGYPSCPITRSYSANIGRIMSKRNFDCKKSL